MALQQEIINENGTTTLYHRIAKAELNYTEKKAKVFVESYVSEAIRQKEKDSVAAHNLISQYNEELNDLVAEPTEENEARRIELTEYINEHSADNGELKPLNLTETAYELDIPENGFTLEYAYNKLKESAFVGSQDVLEPAAQ